MASELLPCPFCGGTDLSSGGDDKFVGYFCKTCQATGPNHYGSRDWNTRPAPAATDTGLVTVGEVSTVRESVAAFAGHMSSGQLKPGDLLCLRSQAEELLAAERAKKEIAERNRDAARENFLTMQKSAAKLLERAEKAEADLAAEREKALFLKTAMEIAQTHCGLKDKTIDSLEADNAAKDARINGFEGFLDDLAEILGCERDIGDVVNEIDAINNRAEALEAKIAAAEKALEPFADHAKERAVDAPEWRDADTVRIVVTIGDLRKARAVLGGKP